MKLTSIRKILHEKGFDLNNAVMNWKYKGQGTLFWKNKLLNSPAIVESAKNKILDAEFYEAHPHPLITVFTAENDISEVTITFNEKDIAKMIVHIEYMHKANDFPFDDVFTF